MFVCPGGIKLEVELPGQMVAGTDGGIDAGILLYALNSTVNNFVTYGTLMRKGKGSTVSNYSFSSTKKDVK